MPLKLTEIEEKILSLEKVISCQNAEILKTETLITQFLRCLEEQKNALKVFIENKNQLDNDRTEYLMAIKESDNVSCHHDMIDDSSIISCLKRELKNETLSILKGELKRNHDNVDIDLQSKRSRPNTPLPTQGERLRIPQINNRIVHKICLHGHDLYIGGSNGMLLRHSAGYTHIYDINITSNILQIEILKFRTRTSLIAFTSRTIIIFEDIMEYVCHEEIDLPGIGIVFNDLSALYIPLVNGSIKKLHNYNLRIVDYASPMFGIIRCYTHGDWNNSFALISLSDSLLYKTKKYSLIGLDVIRGVTDVVNIRRVKRNKFLCYSHYNIWFFDPNFTVTDIVNYDKIRLLDVSDTSAALVDGDNCLYVYRLLDNGCFGKVVAKGRLEGTVTALSVIDNTVYLAIGDVIFAV